MKQSASFTRSSIGGTTVCALAFLLLAGPVLADKPDHAGKGNSAGKGNAERRDDRRGDDDKRDDRRGDVRRGEYFGDKHRVVVRDYYGEQMSAGHCPPGLAKKRNGCLPPGQAKKWQLGRPLPRDVVFHDVPRDLVVKIGEPPRGYRYVQVAADILLIAVGTAMVVDAIQDLGR